ncbi:hypothetical protein ES703_114311 [subsurface metagenome]
MERRRALRLRYRSVATGGDYDYLRSDPVPPDQIWYVRSHSFENETEARGTARGFIEGHGYDHWLWDQESPAAATLYWSEENLILSEGERLVVRQASCTSGDRIQLLINGELEDLKRPVPVRRTAPRSSPKLPRILTS